MEVRDLIYELTQRGVIQGASKLLIICWRNAKNGTQAKGRSCLFFIAVLVFAVSACTRSHDTCDDLEGTITHTVTELTGVESASVLKRNTDSGLVEVVDHVNGVEFSNLIIKIDLSWIEEQHRFRAPNTFIQSLLSWFVSPVMACSLPTYYEDYQPVVTSVQIHSDSDLNPDYVAGSDLSRVFAVSGAMGENGTLFESSEGGGLLSVRTYSLEAARLGGVLATTPVTPNRHIFTIMVALDDGRAFEIRTAELLVSGV